MIGEMDSISSQEDNNLHPTKSSFHMITQKRWLQYIYINIQLLYTGIITEYNVGKIQILSNYKILSCWQKIPGLSSMQK